MIGRMRRLVRTSADDAGLGLILIIGVSVFIFTIAATATALAVNGITQSRERNAFEGALATSEIGIDRVLAEVQVAYSELGEDYPVPSGASAVEASPWCLGTPVSFPTSGPGAGGVWASETEERDWARAQLDLIVATGTCTQQDDRGEYVVLKPASTSNPKYGKVYALSAMPSFADPEARTRLVKSEYVFMPFRPSHAILSGGDLKLGGASTDVTEAEGVPVGIASIHSNGKIFGTGGSDPNVTGPITSTGPSTTSWSTGGAPTQSIPRVSARQFYQQADSAALPVDWYDLCPGGEVRRYAVPNTPCTGTLIGVATTSTRQLGWEYSVSANEWGASADVLPGTYYAMGSNITALTSGGPSGAALPRLTLVAEAQNASTCATKAYGHISWKKFSITAPAQQSVWMMADGDISTDASWEAGSAVIPVVSGMFVAGDQISLQTSSAGAVGSVVIGEQCATPIGSGGLVNGGASEVKNLHIYFDPNSSAPFTSVITTSLWLDYTGG